MQPKHARTSIPHHRAHLLPPVSLVTMNRATGASGLGRAKLAAVQALVGIIKQGLAFLAQSRFGAVNSPAITSHHRGHRPPFTR